MIFDTHAHYDDEAFEEDRGALIASLAEQGIGRVVNVAADLASVSTSLTLAQQYPFIYAAVGVHPSNVQELTERDYEWLEEKLAAPKAVAVGEIGLDYYWDKEPEVQARQRESFSRQLQLAKKLDKPVIIHSRDAAKDTLETEIYLDSCGHANTSSGDGVLSFKLPEKESQDSYDYDPQNPSTHIIDMSENEIEVPEDYTEEEKRQDMLCYSTDPLEKDVVITGDITVSLYIASDAPDTDFMVRLTDVDENGRSIKLADGILSAKYRNGFDHADFLNPGEVVPLTILTTKISNCFKKGHRIRVTITSSAKNFVFPNSNTKDGFNSQTTVVAHNTIFHGGQYPSKITVRMEQ